MAEYTGTRCDGVAEENLPELSDCDDDMDDEEQWQPVEAEEEEAYSRHLQQQQQVTCLFCDRTLSSVAATLQHCSAEHQVDLVEAIRRYNLDDYGYIKMINFIRSTRCDAACLLGLPDASLPWESEDFLRPVLPDDPLLQTDPEELCTGEGSNQRSLPTGTHSALLQRAQAAEERARVSEEALARAMDDLHKLRLLAQGLVLSSDCRKPGNQGGLGSVAELREDEDEAYFSSYGHYGIHEEMLKV